MGVIPCQINQKKVHFESDHKSDFYKNFKKYSLILEEDSGLELA